MKKTFVIICLSGLLGFLITRHFQLIQDLNDTQKELIHSRAKNLLQQDSLARQHATIGQLARTLEVARAHLKEERESSSQILRDTVAALNRQLDALEFSHRTTLENLRDSFQLAAQNVPASRQEHQKPQQRSPAVIFTQLPPVEENWKLGREEQRPRTKQAEMSGGRKFFLMAILIFLIAIFATVLGAAIQGLVYCRKRWR